MKKQILNLGRSLSKTEQKDIKGGTRTAVAFCDGSGGCPSGTYCDGYFCYRDNNSGNPGSGNNNGDGNCIPDRFCVNEYDTCCIG